MKSRKGIGTMGAILAIAALLVVGGFASTQFSIGETGDQPAEVKDATLNLAASELGSSSKISTTAYVVLPESGTVVSQSLSSGQFTAWTSTFTNQMSDVKVLAFDSSNYPIEETISFEGATTLNEVIKTAPIADAADVSIELRETSGTDDNDGAVDIAAGGQATLDSVRAQVDTQDNYWNVGAVYVDTPDNSNVTIDMPNAESIAVPDSAADGVDKAFRTFSPSNGEDTFEEFDSFDSSQVVINGDDSNDPSESVTVYVDDVQANQNSDTGEREYVVEDSSDSNLGLAPQSTTLTVN